jgi:hypothetical protein
LAVEVVAEPTNPALLIQVAEVEQEDFLMDGFLQFHLL